MSAQRGKDSLKRLGKIVKNAGMHLPTHIALLMTVKIVPCKVTALAASGHSLALEQTVPLSKCRVPLFLHFRSAQPVCLYLELGLVGIPI